MRAWHAAGRFATFLCVPAAFECGPVWKKPLARPARARASARRATPRRAAPRLPAAAGECACLAAAVPTDAAWAVVAAVHDYKKPRSHPSLSGPFLPALGASPRPLCPLDVHLAPSSHATTSRHHAKPTGVLRHHRRWRAPRPRRHGAPPRRGAQDGRELPRPVHGREGRRQVGQAAALQGIQLPPRDPAVHVPGRRLHRRKRHGWRVHLWLQVRRRELQAQAHWPRCPVHGQRWAGHQRLPVLPVHGLHAVAGRQARRVWRCGGGHGRGEEGRVLRLGQRQDLEEDRHRRLRPAVVSGGAGAGVLLNKQARTATRARPRRGEVVQGTGARRRQRWRAHRGCRFWSGRLVGAFSRAVPARHC